MKRNIVVIALILLAVIVFSAWYFFPHSSNANPPSRVIFMHPDGSTDTVYVQVANTLQEQEQGLMYRTSLPEDNGMLFVFNTDSIESFWMKNTPLPLDMIFVSEDLTITDINYNATPESDAIFTSSSPCKYVVEVNGGYCVQHGISTGDKIKIDM